jgi:predicted TIM-barrel fold metal-dependent hydrolase
VIVDFNIHLPPDGDFTSETDFSRFDALASWEALKPRIADAGIGQCNVMLLDPGLMASPSAPIVGRIAADGHSATVGIDPRFPNALELIDAAAKAGARGIKFHPYFMGLEDKDFDKAVAAARRAETHGMWVCVCCSYGTKNVYRISGIRLLLALIQAEIRTPIVALHAGGRHVLDVMLACYDAPNVMLEISFSIPYWLGSSVEQDFLFAMRKLGVERFMYASDHPHQPLEQNLATVWEWLTSNGFSETEQALIFSGNAKRALLDQR